MENSSFSSPIVPSPAASASRGTESEAAREGLFGRRRTLKTLFGSFACGAIASQGRHWIHAAETAIAQAGASPGTAPSSGATKSADATSGPGSPSSDADRRDYEAFLAGLGLIHIKPIEILRPHFKVRGAVKNTIPPRELWTKMPPTLRVADRLRTELGVALTSIVSAYRCPQYNAACSGAATQSYHMKNVALDLQFACEPAKVAEAAESLRSRGFFKGGIGRYPGFTHVDTRGLNASW